MRLVVAILLLSLLSVHVRAQTVVFQDTFSNASDTNWTQDTARAVTFDTACSGADYPTCVAIHVVTGDLGHNLLELTTFSFPSEYWTYYKMYLPPNADFGTASANFKLGYNYAVQTCGGGGDVACNVLYYDGAVNTESPLTGLLRAYADNPNGAMYTYFTASFSAGWHILQQHIKPGSVYEIRWDNLPTYTFPADYPTETLPNYAMVEFDPGLYTNSAVGATYDLLLNNVEICTGTWCDPGSNNGASLSNATLSGGASIQ
jgi:hypothetical protein